MRAPPRTALPAIDDAWLRRVAASATPLWERRPPTGRATRAQHAAAKRRLARWRDVLGGPRILRSRLRGSALRPATLPIVLAGRQRAATLPSWARTLGRIMGRATPGGSRRDRSCERNAPLPFQEVLVAFVEHARVELGLRAGAALGILGVAARTALERHLLAHLTFVASPTIGRDFYAYRFEHAPASVFERAWSRQPRTRVIYRAYVRHMEDGGLARLLEAHPVLARLLAQSVEQWADAVAELCERFRDDFADLRTFFGWTIARPAGAVVHVTAGLSDRHHGGRSVIACRLRGGDEIVYKPRTVRPEVAFSCFVGWLHERRLSLDLGSPRALDRKTHGWVEAVACAPVRTRAEVDRFHRRAGMLLAALYALAATDVHRENVIASGEHPVVVDLETMLNDAVRASPRRMPGRRTAPSVMSTGMLPFPRSRRDDDADMSALGSDDTQDPGLRTFAWDAVNTDQMRLVRETPSATGMTHRVRLGRRHPSALAHLPSLLDGFRETYACLLEHRERLITDADLLGAFDDLTLRILVRSTLTYTRLQLHALQPGLLRDGIDRSIELEWLARPLAPRATQEGPRRLYACERDAMERLDVPHLTTDEWSAMEGHFDDEDMRELVRARDSRVLVKRLRGLSPRDCARQLAIIERAIRARFTTRGS